MDGASERPGSGRVTLIPQLWPPETRRCAATPNLMVRIVTRLGRHHIVNRSSKTLGIVLVAVVMSGCTSSSDTQSGGSGSDRPSSEPSTSPSVQSTPEEPTEEPTPTVESATGETIKVKGMRVNLPADWVATSSSALEAGGYPRGNSDSFLTLFRFPQLLVESLDEQARDNATRSDWDFRLERREDVTVDGQLVSHLSGRSRPGEYTDLFSTLRNDQQLEVEFLFGGDESRAIREQIVQSVLASWEFTG